MMKIFAIRDITCGLYVNITLEHNEQTAIRGFENAMLQQGSLMNTHGDSFELVYLGDFIRETGELVPCDHKVVMTGKANR